MEEKSASEPVQPCDERSLRAGLRQAWGWAVMFGAGELSFSLFAAHIVAPHKFFALLTGIPMLLGPLTQALAANLVDRYRRRKAFVLWSVFSQIVCFVPLTVLAFCTGGPLVYAVFLLAVSAYFVGGHFGAPAWSSLISELVPSRRWADYFARQSRAVSVLGLVSQLAVGGALYLAGRWAAPESAARVLSWVFAAGFAIAGLARLYSFLLVQQMADPPYEVRPDTIFTFWQFIRRARESNFVHFVSFTALVYFGTYLSGPFFLPYWQYDLGYQSWQWVVMSAAGTLASILTLLFWGRFSDRFGNKKAIRYTTFGISLIPFAWMFSTNLYYLVAVNLFSGMVWAGFNLSSWNYILEAVTPPKRARCVAYFNVFAGAGIFVGALVGGWLEPWLPPARVAEDKFSAFWYLLLISGLIRLGAWVILLPTFRELRQVEPFSLRGWVFRIAEARYPVGVVFDFLGLQEQKTESTEDRAVSAQRAPRTP